MKFLQQSGLALLALLLSDRAYGGPMDDVQLECARLGTVAEVRVCTIDDGWFRSTMTYLPDPIVFPAHDVDLDKVDVLIANHEPLFRRFFAAGGTLVEVPVWISGKGFTKTGRPKSSGIAWSDWEAQ